MPPITPPAQPAKPDNHPLALVATLAGILFLVAWAFIYVKNSQTRPSPAPIVANQQSSPNAEADRAAAVAALQTLTPAAPSQIEGAQKQLSQSNAVRANQSQINEALIELKN